MAEPRVRLICDAQVAIGESPARLGDRVYWTDPVARRLLSVADNGELQSGAMASPVWSLAGSADKLLGALDDRFCTIAKAGEISSGPAATIDAGCRFNDMTVDASGGLWVGMMHRGVLATRGAIFHAPSLRAVPTRVASGLGVPNGMKLSADGRTLHIVDTLERTLLAYPADGGKLGEPVIVSDFLGLPGKPDGMTLAVDGTFWVAMWGGGCVVQLPAMAHFSGRSPSPRRTSAACASHLRSACS